MKIIIRIPIILQRFTKIVECEKQMFGNFRTGSFMKKKWDFKTGWKQVELSGRVNKCKIGFKDCLEPSNMESTLLKCIWKEDLTYKCKFNQTAILFQSFWCKIWKFSSTNQHNFVI
jgi:hypothetical protein